MSHRLNDGGGKQLRLFLETVLQVNRVLFPGTPLNRHAFRYVTKIYLSKENSYNVFYAVYFQITLNKQSWRYSERHREEARGILKIITILTPTTVGRENLYDAIPPKTTVASCHLNTTNPNFKAFFTIKVTGLPAKT